MFNTAAKDKDHEYANIDKTKIHDKVITDSGDLVGLLTKALDDIERVINIEQQDYLNNKKV